MRKAAEVGRGSFTHIGDLREVKPRMAALLAKLEQPALTDLRVGWPLTAGKRIELYPRPLRTSTAANRSPFPCGREALNLRGLTGRPWSTAKPPAGPCRQRFRSGPLPPGPAVAPAWARARRSGGAPAGH